VSTVGSQWLRAPIELVGPVGKADSQSSRQHRRWRRRTVRVEEGDVGVDEHGGGDVDHVRALGVGEQRLHQEDQRLQGAGREGDGPAELPNERRGRSGASFVS
jgi:hypothetical protein